MTSCNVGLIIFLSLKNTPLAFLTAYSYERLRILHSVAGFTTIIYMAIHAIVYTSALAEEDHLEELIEKNQIMGIVAGLSMIIILVSVLFLRRMRYEVFYIIHVVFAMLVVITAAMHRPAVSKRAVLIMIVAGALWMSDRILRLGRLLWFSYGNNVTVTPLPQGGMRLTLRRSSWRAVPGSHVFLWIPSIRAAETHPFTVVSTNPIELVVKAHDGFTRDLLAYAEKNPGAALRASIDGPYGTLPNFMNFDRVVLVAGGSGASFTFGVALNIARRFSPQATRPIIDFIWVVREHGMSIQHNLVFLTNSQQIIWPGLPQSSTRFVLARQYTSPSTYLDPVKVLLP